MSNGLKKFINRAAHAIASGQYVRIRRELEIECRSMARAGVSMDEILRHLREKTQLPNRTVFPPAGDQDKSPDSPRTH